jgi:hypothetical protein
VPHPTVSRVRVLTLLPIFFCEGVEGVEAAGKFYGGQTARPTNGRTLSEKFIVSVYPSSASRLPENKYARR